MSIVAPAAVQAAEEASQEAAQEPATQNNILAVLSGSEKTSSLDTYGSAPVAHNRMKITSQHDHCTAARSRCECLVSMRVKM